MQKLYFQNEKPKKKINVVITIIGVVALMVTGLLYVSQLRTDREPTKSVVTMQKGSGM